MTDNDVLDLVTSIGDRDVSGRYRLTLTAVRSGGAWKVAAVHVGALQAAASSPPGEPR
ncbi:hypothetical protein [Pseudonocardia charpentierae]|uniref:SnoaL-like domain-containing protein n=1 Tax=Pseudonocardia charpentierae TaxID=3075545 RepID=A0ABU2N3D8_9PSEU|nr:hypothetical protein [Pseudonocardia sp. DSM 45834]MDT0348280.1 hypothetical protein [Pseudonocardia sp. DSM 45834]